jgi:ubiquinone/menaquinone biosynthesis C-methylase UbiE
MRPSWYERHVLPSLIDAACGFRCVWHQRHKVVPLAEGCILEIGIGTGLNLEHYNKANIKKIVGLDPGLGMYRRARKRIKQASLAVKLVGSSAENVPYQDSSFDTVLVTYSLCTIPNPVAALKEMRRALRRCGKLIFCEHGLAPDTSVRRWQDRLTPLWAKLAGGCQLNRDIPSLLREAGFHSVDIQSMYLPGPRPLTYNYWGTAVVSGRRFKNDVDQNS